MNRVATQQWQHELNKVKQVELLKHVAAANGHEKPK